METPNPTAEFKAQMRENADHAIDRAVADLKVSLPNGSAPKPFKLIALVTFVGGIGISWAACLSISSALRQ